MNEIEINNGATPYYSGDNTPEKLLKELEASGHTYEDWITSLKQINSFMVCYGVYISIRSTKIAIEKLRSIKSYNKAKGYKVELNRLEAYCNSYKVLTDTYVGQDMSAVNNAICESLWEDIEPYVENIRNKIRDVYQSCYHPQSTLMSYLVTAHVVCEYVISMIEVRQNEVSKYSPGWKVKKGLFPKQLGFMIDKTIDRLTFLTCTHDINPKIECDEILDSIEEMDNCVTDVDALELYNAYGIERTEGKEALKQKYQDSYYMLHPMEDPSYVEHKRVLEELKEYASEEEAEEGE